MRAHYEVSKRGRLRVTGHRSYTFLLRIIMLAIRLYIAALTLAFLVVVIAHRGIGILEATVITCAIIYLILDARTDLQIQKAEFQALQELEQRISELLR